MKLYEIYEDTLIQDAWARLEQALNDSAIIDEDGSGRLTTLIKEAEKVVLTPFGIDSSEKKYYIAGSARLYQYPGLIEMINELNDSYGVEEKMPSQPGDLDMVIPNEKDWETLKNNLSGKVNEELFNRLLSAGMYKPDKLGLTQMDIEAFTEWDPKKAGEEYADKPIDTNQSNILGRASQLNGYYYMSLYDILSYKYHLGRPKELAIAKVIDRYLKVDKDKKASVSDINQVLRKVADVIKSGGRL